MLIATGALVEFGRFVQILLWIVLPVFISSALITSWFHKRKTKKKVTPHLADPSTLKDQYIFFDHTGVLAEYKQQLSVNHARYTALKHDHEKLKQQNDRLKAELQEYRRKENEVELIIPRDGYTDPSELRSVRDILEDSKSQIAFLHCQISEQEEQIELLIAQKKALLNELKNNRIVTA